MSFLAFSEAPKPMTEICWTFVSNIQNLIPICKTYQISNKFHDAKNVHTHTYITIMAHRLHITKKKKNALRRVPTVRGRGKNIEKVASTFAHRKKCIFSDFQISDFKFFRFQISKKIRFQISKMSDFKNFRFQISFFFKKVFFFKLF